MISAPDVRWRQQALDRRQHARHGVSGVVNVMPFSCMPGIIVAGMASRVRADFNQLPWLDIVYDGQHLTNIRTRLEAFVHQVAQFARSHERTH